MTIRQKLMKWLYPLIMKLSKKTDKGLVLKNGKNTFPAKSFYHLKNGLNNGQELDFNNLRGKKVMIVNTASNCGFTNQYESLQKLYEANQDKLVILGFPSNDFKEQEKGDEDQIAQFCQINFGVSFPLMKKSVVVKEKDQNQVFEWLSTKNENGWNEQAPVWNFSKYIINEFGQLTHFFGPAIDPEDPQVLMAINK
jgi:glutathione peroxidase